MPHAEPPSDRAAAWLASVAEPAVRELDQQLLVDLLAIELRGPGAETAADLVRDYLRTASPPDADRFRRRCAERGVQLPVAVSTRRSPTPPPPGDLPARYAAAVVDATALWDTADKVGAPNLVIARRLIADLTDAVREYPEEMVALSTTAVDADYTFTHMVNVAVLTMSQARRLGFDGLHLEEIGLAALLHDIGKVRTPTHILEKPDRLTDAEFEIMMRHTIDGAEMLRAVIGMPPLAPVIAFEHHLRLDGSGYPRGVHRDPLNVVTQMCSIADVFDAMRSLRSYQPPYSRERILDVLRREGQFDRELVASFAQLLDVLPPSEGAVAP